MTPLTQSVLAIIAACRQAREELQGVTPGPWKAITNGPYRIGHDIPNCADTWHTDIEIIPIGFECEVTGPIDGASARFIVQARTLTPLLLDDTIELLEVMLKIYETTPGLAATVLRSTVTRWETANLIPK